MFRPFNNAWIKLIALVMGLLLWIHVATEKVYNHQISLPLKEIILKDHLTLASNPPESLTVMVSASGKQLLRRKWRQRGIRVNATQVSTGREEMALTIANTSLIGAEDVTLDEILAPNSISLQVDYLAQKTVKVIADIVTFPDEGYTVRTITEPEPPEVTITGPRSLLQDYSSIATIRKEIRGLRTDLTLSVPLAEPEEYGIVLTPDSVTVSLEVVPVRTRVFDDVPIMVYNSPVNRTIKSRPPTVRIELTGPPEAIESLSRSAVIASVDFNEKDAYGVANIKIDCPAGFRVKRVSAQQVRLVAE
ncbi:MAG: CdaR family protein [candidate division Zixibacteria bacterium]|nr:CdaR family protein [candidate division Zixibacteria bacterium]